ncbi:MAG: ribosome silencing factor [Rhodospirillaceae bacterium]
MGFIGRSLDADQAEGAVIVDLAGKSSMADFMVIASGRSARHVGAMAGNLRERLKAAGVTGIEIEGMPHCDWVLLDAGDVIIHLFRPEVRAFYNLEKLWGVESPAFERSGLEEAPISAESCLDEAEE